MKARNVAKEQLWQRAIEISRETVLIWLVALHREFGFSAQRLSRLAMAAAKVQEESSEYNDDGLLDKWYSDAIDEIGAAGTELERLFTRPVGSYAAEKKAAGAQKKTAASFTEAERLREKMEAFRNYQENRGGCGEKL